MPVVRVYLPLSRADFDELASAGSLQVGASSRRVVHAVTPELERSAPGLDVEDLEYAAFRDAVAAATGVRESSRQRRVVAAADAEPAWLEASNAGTQGGPASAMVLVITLPVVRVASLHVDENAPTASGQTGGDDADDLLWYDITELDEVRGLLA